MSVPVSTHYQENYKENPVVDDRNNLSGVKCINRQKKNTHHSVSNTSNFLSQSL